MKRYLIFLSIVVIVGCASGPANTAGGSNDITVLWMRAPSERQELLDLIQSYADDFNAAHEDTTVTIEFVDWADGRDAIEQRVAEGTPPDLAVVGSRWVAEFVNQGLIEPLDRYMTPSFREQFIASLINEGAIYQERTFGLPVAASTRALYYNLDLFEQAGLSEPPASWDELLLAGQVIGALEEDVYGFALQGGDGLETNTYFYYFVWGNGGSLYDPSQTSSALDSPESVEALVFLQELIQEGATQPDPASDAYNRRRALEDLFQQGQVGMVISGPWLLNRLQDESPDMRIGVAPIPFNTTSATYGVIDTLVMFRTSASKDAAWDFMDFIYTTERRLAYAQTAGVLPELDAVAESEELAQDEQYVVFLDLLPEARFEPPNIHSEEISQIVIDAVRSVYLGDAEPQDALDDAAALIDNLLQDSTAGW
ncbi:MAG: sugar ABC transporter substrate-binding protein [Chloroflexi bacterium]|nr:sugar ABC transporter substrate-binding protein [Chloroflexota bacterium]